MRGLSRAVLLGALAAGVAVNLSAQRGGGGFHGGGGFSSGGRAAAQSVPLPSATALGAGALRFGPSSTARSTQAARGFIFPNGRVTRLTTGRPFRSSRALPFAYWLSPWYFPFDYGDPSGAAPDDSGYDPNAEAAFMAQSDLAEQVRRLSAQMAQLQSGQQPQPPPDMGQQETQPPPVPVTLILHDGQQLQVQNYAVMDQTFWDFTRQPVRKIPISTIDIAASTKATEANGGEFPQLP